MKINHFGLFESIFIWAYMCFSVVGQSGQNFFQNFRSRFGFLVQFYPYPINLGLKKYAQDQELLIFGVFF
jgi:hypothetical protein